MSKVTPIVVKGQSNVFTELSQFAVSNLEVLKGGNNDPGIDFIDEHIDY